MKKINFEAGTQISPAKVTIDDVEHNVTPAIYEGNTPLSPYVLNTLQDNIEEEINVINSRVEILESITERNIITAKLSANYTTTSTDAEKVTLVESSKLGNALSISDGGIKIGEGITKIKVSGQVFFSGGMTSGDALAVYLYKNSGAINTLQEKCTGATTLTFAESLVDVREKDIIYLKIRDITTAGAVANTFSYLTVEAVA